MTTQALGWFRDGPPSLLVRITYKRKYHFQPLYKVGQHAMSKKRPGVSAGMNLVELEDPSVWERVEQHGQQIYDSIEHLQEKEVNLAKLQSQDSISKSDLELIVSWKHAVGRNRIYNVKHLKANTDETVTSLSRAAIEKARNLSDCCNEDGSLSDSGKKLLQECFKELERLNGVGPATASAILSVFRPDLFCYMYDEVIDCFEKARDYKLAVYLRVNSRCLQIGKTLDWTPQRVAKTIWTAARFLAYHGEDLTQEASDDSKPPGTDQEDSKAPARPYKKRRKSS